MSSLNLAIVWAPVLMQSPDQMMNPKELYYQTRVFETILNNFESIFETEEE